MIEIDGARLEGGGQLVRGAVALSALSGEPIEISNIRKNRSRQGLAAQHLAAVSAVAALCDAECSGLLLDSRMLQFHPATIKKHEFSLDIGTAGSIALVLQAWLPVALRTGGTITITGGTEVLRSPTIDYFDRVFCELLRRRGGEISLEIRRRGYYPRGGGKVVVTVSPHPPARLDIHESPGDYTGIISCSSNLPAHVAERQAAAAARAVVPYLGRIPIRTDSRTGPSTGSSCTVWAGLKGGSALGKRGYPAENVGGDAAAMLIAELGKPGLVDTHLADQLIIPLSEFGGSFTTSSLSLHAKTMVWLCAEFGREIGVAQIDSGVIVVSA